MVYYAVAVAVLIVWATAASFLAVWLLRACERIRTKYESLLQEIGKLKETVFMSGWNEAKEAYYTQKKREEEGMFSAIQKENESIKPDYTELLVAYGVSKVGQLPKSIRSMYNIPETDNDVSLNVALINEDEEV